MTSVIAAMTQEPLGAAERPRHSSIADWLVELAGELADEGRYEQALQEVRKALLIHPHHTEALRALERLASRIEPAPEPAPRRETLGPAARVSPPDGSGQAPPAASVPEVPPRAAPSAEVEPRAIHRAVRVEAELGQLEAVLRGDAMADAVREAMIDLERRRADVILSEGAAPSPASQGPLLPAEPDRAPAAAGLPAGVPMPAASSGRRPAGPPTGIRVVIDGQAVSFEQPVAEEDGALTLPLKEMAAALGYGVINLGEGAVRLIAPDSRTVTVQLASPDPALRITEEELREHLQVRSRYDAAERTLLIETGAPQAFVTYSVPKSPDQLQAEAAVRQAVERAGWVAEAPTEIPESARPSVEVTGDVTYSYDDPHAAAPFRDVTASAKGRVFGFDLASETVRKDRSGTFRHDYSFLNLSKPGLFIGTLDQRTDLYPLRSQFEEFNGVQVRKTWGPVDDAGYTSASSRFRPLEPGRVGLSATTLSWGRTEQTVSGRVGSVTYRGQLYEARQEWEATEDLRLKGALLYLRNETDFPHLSGTSAYPRNNLVPFGGVSLDLSDALSVSGHAARARYEPDDDPENSIVDWSWRTGADWMTDRHTLQVAHEFAGGNFASVGDPATYQDYRGTSVFGRYRLTEHWSLIGSLLRYQDNVDDDPDSTTTENQALSLSTAFQPSPLQSVTLRYSNLVADPAGGPAPGSSSRSVSYGMDYFLPFLLSTRLLTSYEYFRTEAPADSDTISQTGSVALFRGFGRGSSWYVREQARKTFRELEDDGLSLDTTLNLTYQVSPQLSSYLNSSYSRNLVDGASGGDVASAAVGVRYDTVADTTLGLEYEIGPYDLDTERHRWPRNWSIFFLVKKRFGFATPPAFGRVEGVVFRDLNGDGAPDPGEPGVEEATVRLDEGRRTALTDREGQFAFSHVAPGTQDIRLDLASLDPLWTAVEPRRAVTVGRRKTVVVPFPLIQGAFIGGRVFVDENGDGVFQETEEPLEDVAVVLLPGEEFRRTDADGAFRFEYLLPGTYTLRLHVQDLPGGYALASSETVDVMVAAGDEVEEVAFAVRLSVPVQQF